jgi:hypothetical protein
MSRHRTSGGARGSAAGAQRRWMGVRQVLAASLGSTLPRLDNGGYVLFRYIYIYIYIYISD